MLVKHSTEYNKVHTLEGKEHETKYEKNSKAKMKEIIP